MVTGEPMTGVTSGFVFSTRTERKTDNAETGTLTSETFRIPKGYGLAFALAGGKDAQKLSLSLTDASGAVLRTATGNGSYNFKPVLWKETDLTEKDVRLVFNDRSTESHGFIAAADFKLVPVPQPAPGSGPSIVNIDPGLQVRLTALTSQYIAANNIPAGYAFIVKDGEMVARCAVGMANKEKGIPAAITDQLAIASVSKTVTSILIGKLVDSGVMRWDMTIQEVFPEYASKYPQSKVLNATVRQLFCHHAGIGSDKRYDNKFKGIEWRKNLLEQVLQDPNSPGPSEQYAYGAAPIFAALMAERLTGKDYDTLMREKICKPLGITSFVMGRGPRTPTGYGIYDTGIHPTPPMNFYQAYDPTGGVCLTLEDIAKVILLRTGIEMRSESDEVLNVSALNRHIMDTPPYTSKEGEALGIFSVQDSGVKWLWHSGLRWGYISHLNLSQNDGGRTMLFYHFTLSRPSGDPRPSYKNSEYEQLLRRLH